MTKSPKHKMRLVIFGVAAYVLAVGYGLIFRDVGMRDVLFGLPIGITLVVGILFLLVYEVLILGLPFAADTMLFVLRWVLPRRTYCKVEVWVFAKWGKTPEMMQHSPRMKRRYADPGVERGDSGSEQK